MGPSNVILYLIMAAFPILSIFLAGWASNNKYSLFGAMRSVAQLLSYELPITFVILSVVVLASSMNLTGITLAQFSGWGLFSWFFIPCFLGFVIMFISILAELNRCPFDLPEAESELVSGYNTEYSGMKFALFFLAEYSLLFILSCLFVVLFLGGYTSVFGDYVSFLVFSENSFWGKFFVFFEQIFWMFVKVFFVIFMVIWVRATLPRMKMNSLIGFCWKFLFPISVINFLLLALFGYFVG